MDDYQRGLREYAALLGVDAETEQAGLRATSPDMFDTLVRHGFGGMLAGAAAEPGTTGTGHRRDHRDARRRTAPTGPAHRRRAVARHHARGTPRPVLNTWRPTPVFRARSTR